MKRSKALSNKLQSAINEQKNRIGEINTYIDFLKGKQYPRKPGRDEATFNIVHTTIQAILNSVMRGNSHIYVDPASSIAVEPAPVVERVINYWWEKLDAKYQEELAVIDYAALGMGIIYVDWDYETDENGKIVKDQPAILHVPYKDFLIDPRANAEEIDEAGFMVRSFIKNVKELKADKRYKNTKDISGDVKLAQDVFKTKDLAECVRLYQIWVLNEGASYVMREGSDDILRTVENKLGREYPFELMQNYNMPDELWPFGEVKILFEPQKILNRMFSLIMTHARRVSTRQYVANGQISDTELRKLRDAKDGEVLKVEGNAKAPDVVSPIQDAPLSGDVYRAYELINGAIVQLTSISEYRRSSMPQKQRKATEAALIEQGTDLSVNSKAEDVTKHCEGVARKIFKLLKDDNNINMRELTYKDEKSGEWLTDNYNKDSFPGEYAFRWESGVEGPLNASARQQKSLSLLQTIANITRLNPDISRNLNWQELLKSALAPFDLKNVDDILSPPEDMQEMPLNMPQGMPQGNVDPALLDEVMANLNR